MSLPTETQVAFPDSTCRRIHVEDLRKNDWIAIIDQVFQYPTCCWLDLDRQQYPPEKPIEIWFRNSVFSALQVKDIALPFICCVDTAGNCEVIDVRQARIVKVPKSFCKSVRKISKQASTRRKKSKR